MAIVQLIYVSEASVGTDLDTVEEIVQCSRENNRTLGVSGYLAFNSKYFIQVLEGGREVVSSLYNSICQDSRHQRVTLCSMREISCREFADWSLGLVRCEGDAKGSLLKFTEEGEFDPFAMAPETIHAYLVSMAHGSLAMPTPQTVMT